MIPSKWVSAQNTEYNHAAVRTSDLPTCSHAWLCQQIVDHAQEAIIVADREGIIHLWNAGAEAMFGYRADEALGQTLDLIIPERLRPRHWAAYRQTMTTGVSRYGRELLAVPAICKDGRHISLEFSIVILRDETGEILGPAAIIREVTARWQRDKALKARVAALEAHAKNVSVQSRPSDGADISSQH